MLRNFTATVWQEGEWFIAQCLEVDVISQGENEREALANLKEALSLHFKEPRATILPKLHKVKVEVHAP
ncbi:MAG: type II toxin-antitoxin system HicB family antitoxin [Chloroflexi bacterium]|nr:type II toxin-antitoxin system HicB family antitoxin [Chloroflexota bacterium]